MKDKKIVLTLGGLVILIAVGSFLTPRDESIGEVLKVAAILPLSGPAAFPGEETRQGMLLALDEVNKDGKKIELIIKDSKTKASEGILVFNQLENTYKPDVYVSGTSAVSMSLAPLAGKFKVPLVAVFTYATEFTEQNEYSFRFFPLASDEIPVVMQNLKDLEAKKIGIIHLNDDYGNSVERLLSEAIEKEGLESTSKSFLAPDKSFKTQILQLKEEKVDSIYAVGYDGHLINIVSQADEVGFEGNFFPSVALAQPENLKKVDPEILEGSRSAYPKVSVEFSEKFNNKYGYYPGVYGPNGYDLVHMLANNLKARDTREETKNRLYNIDTDVETAVGSISQYGREIPFKLYPIKIVDGKAVYK